jgi:hypothetical protein
MSKVENETRVRVDFTDKHGKKDLFISDEERAQEFLAELQAENSTGAIVYSQTFGFHEVSDTDPLNDFNTLVASPAEQANIINAGLRSKQRRYTNDLLKQDNFTPVEGVYDLSDACAAVTERKSASPEQKAANQLSKLLGRQVSTEELAAILSAMGPASATA